MSTSDAAIQRFERPGFVRATASDRPGVAQPVPERDVPPQPWGRILLGALLLCLTLTAAWEAYWRDFGAVPSYRNSDAAWAQQRRRIDDGEGDALVLLGSSRTLGNVQLDVWERLSGRRPIQLALEGTSPTIPLEQLADDPDFTGAVLVDITAGQFRGGEGVRTGTFKYYVEQGPSQRIGHWLSMHALEPHLAFYDPDYALARVVRRQAWPARPGLVPRPVVRKLFLGGPDRNRRLWDKLERDPRYLAQVRADWATLNWRAPPPPPALRAKWRQQREAMMTRIAAAVAKLRARGVGVVFVRHPVTGPYADWDRQAAPRADNWDVLLARTGAPGIHSDDYPQLRGYRLPDWSHIAAADADRYTAALQPIVERTLRAQSAASTRNARIPPPD